MPFYAKEISSVPEYHLWNHVFSTAQLWRPLFLRNMSVSSSFSLQSHQRQSLRNDYPLKAQKVKKSASFNQPIQIRVKVPLLAYFKQKIPIHVKVSLYA